MADSNSNNNNNGAGMNNNSNNNSIIFDYKDNMNLMGLSGPPLNSWAPWSPLLSSNEAKTQK